MPDAAVILVVEDREDDVVLLRRAFRSAGVLNPLVWVKSGDEAISYMRGTGDYWNRAEFPLPRMILLDLKMHGLDGFDVLSFVRARREFASIAIIVLTSSTDLKDVQRAYDLGANSFIVKETEFDNMVTLSKILKDYWIRLNKAYDVQRPPKQDADNSPGVGDGTGRDPVT
jgi:CheY-like chemotaxis protein